MFDKNVNILFNSGHYCIENKNGNVNLLHIKSGITLFNKDTKLMSSKKKQKVAIKLHGQFSHSHSDEHLTLLMLSIPNESNA